MYQESALQPLEDHKRRGGSFSSSLDLSNCDLPAFDQFEAFRSTYRGVMDVSMVASDLQSFPARQTVWNLDRLALMRTKLPGIGHAHRQKHLKNCALDHWYIFLPVRFRSEFDDEYEAESTVPELHCLAASFEREVRQEGALTLFVPQDLFASAAGLDRKSVV